MTVDEVVRGMWELYLRRLGRSRAVMRSPDRIGDSVSVRLPPGMRNNGISEKNSGSILEVKHLDGGSK